MLSDKEIHETILRVHENLKRYNERREKINSLPSEEKKQCWKSEPTKETENKVITNDTPIEKPRRERCRNELLFNKAIKLYNEGKYQVEIAKIVNRNKATISKWIKEYKSNNYS